ncbi:glycosyltransferase family 39 protein [Amycolatopsis sp. NPDC021455]|uniref:ArnT family glycosyltransferase n=1 Tax=Amycolatopsis sp. NPDC021455 TaxID=3154901 RepID=UPI0033EE2332
MTTAAVRTPVPSRSPTGPIPSFARRPVLLVAGAAVALLLAVAGRYGYFFDELYFRVAGEHLDWGYIDQPPLLPLLAKVQIALFGDHVWAIRVVPALLAGLTVVVAALVARELGGDRGAQTWTAIAVAGSPYPLWVDHLLQTAGVDILVWVTLCWLTLRMLRTRDRRWWVVFGAVGGIGLQSKNLVALLVIALLAGLVVAGDRDLLRGRHLPIGLGVAALLGGSAVLWQATHGWPQFAMADAIAASTLKSGWGTYLATFAPFVATLLGPFVAVVWLCGLAGFFRARWRPYRAVGVAFVVVCLLIAVSGGFPTYTAGFLPVLLAAGCVVAGDWARRGRRVVRTAVLRAAIGLNVVLVVAAGLPLVSPEALGHGFLFRLNPTLSRQVGWPELAGQVAAVYDRIPAVDRPHTAIVTGTFGEAGALDRYGPEHGLPPVYSGHNSYLGWGRPGPEVTTVLAVDLGPEITELFMRCEPPVPVADTAGARTITAGKTLVVCRDPRAPWSALWPRFGHTDLGY